MSRQRAEGGFITELLPAREAGLPVKFIVSVMPEPGRSPSTLTPSKAADCETYDTLIERPKQAPVALLTDDSSWIYGKEENDRSLSHPSTKTGHHKSGTHCQIKPPSQQSHGKG
jgi:hypothetical protein